MKKRIVSLLAIAAATLLLAACGKTTTQTKPTAPKVDYTAAKLETALNAGKKVQGKTVKFKISKIEPNSAFGFNLETGKHLNFISKDGKAVNKGDTVTAKIKKSTSVVGSWVITYSSLKHNGKPVASKAINKTTTTKAPADGTIPTDAKHEWFFNAQKNVFYAGNETMTLTKSEVRDGLDGTKVLVIYNTIRNNSTKEQDPSNFYMVINAKQKTATSNVDLDVGMMNSDENGNDPLQQQEDNLNNALLPGKTVETVLIFELKNTNPVTLEFSNSNFETIGTKEYAIQ